MCDASLPLVEVPKGGERFVARQCNVLLLGATPHNEEHPIAEASERGRIVRLQLSDLESGPNPRDEFHPQELLDEVVHDVIR